MASLFGRHHDLTRQPMHRKVLQIDINRLGRLASQGGSGDDVSRRQHDGRARLQREVCLF